MGLMDRVRAQATQIAQQAQEAAQEGKARLDQAQAGRRGDMLLRQLGALVFAERTGRGTADSQARIDQLISEISAHESQNGLNLADPPQSGLGQSLFGQSVWGQSVSGQASQPPAGQPAPGQPAPGQSGFGQADPGQQAPGPEAGFSSGPQAAPGQSAPPPGTGAMPPVDTTTSFFPAPGDEDTGTPPQG
jgi:preprotein translocase subunit SecD